MLLLSLRQVVGLFPDSGALQIPATAHQKQVQASQQLFTDTFFTHTVADVLSGETAGETTDMLRASHPKPRKQRYYLNASTQQFSCSPRILYQDDRQDYYVLAKETKGGEYQWHDCFLPAYYTFLFRFTLF